MKIGFVIFDGVTQLDFTGPLQVFTAAEAFDVSVVATRQDPVRTDGALTVLPSHDLTTAPQLDLICVPGGRGVRAAIQDRALVDFVREQAETARYVTSVCTGAFVLGAAGLLEGRKATTHWAYHDLLRLYGAEPVSARVVDDGRLITGGGVTAGIDFALAILATLQGAETADKIRLALEYDPAPQGAGGHPDRVPPQLASAVTAHYQTAVAGMRDAILTAQNA